MPAIIIEFPKSRRKQRDVIAYDGNRARLDCHDMLKAVVRRARTLVVCEVAFPYEVEVLRKEIGILLQAVARFSTYCESEESRDKLTKIAKRARSMYCALPSLQRALEEADLARRMIAASYLDRVLAELQEAASEVFPEPLVPCAS